MAVLFFGGDYLVRGATRVALGARISTTVVALTIVAMGTSLPELAASIMSVIKNEPDIAIGNIIGSNMFNMLMVLGIPVLINPSGFGGEVLLRDFPVMIFMTMLMGWMVFIHGRGKFDRIEGGVLLSCFIAYQFWLFYTISS